MLGELKKMRCFSGKPQTKEAKIDLGVVENISR